ncbi:MAG: histidine kinase [Nitrosopumilaceae archaeon]
MFQSRKNSDEPEIVPEKLHSSISIKTLVVILGIVVSFQIYLYVAFPNPDDPNLDFVVTIFSFITPLIASIAAFFVTKRYWHSKIFGKSYLALSLGMLMNAVGEIAYYILEQQGDVPSPSVADIAFLAFYPLAFYYLAKNIKFFKPKINIITKLLVVALPAIVIGVYAVLEFSQTQTANTEFYLGLSYAVGSAVILSGAILGALIFRQGILGIPWLILAIGLTLTTIGDNWYSYLGIYDQYTLVHPVNMLWYAGYLVVAYALYKHKNVI